MLNSCQQKRLEGGLATQVEYHCSLKDYTTFKIGGAAGALAVVKNRGELAFLLKFCKEEGLPSFCLGRGSNVLIADEGFPGIVFRLAGDFVDVRFSPVSAENVMASAGAGISLARLAGICTGEGFAGMEFCAGIPGSLGGAVVMNAGAWGREMADVVCGVELMDGEEVTCARGEQLDFCYRAWPWFLEKMGRKQTVVTGVECLLRKSTPENVAARCRSLAKSRKEKQRVGMPNAGSFFKNPAGQSAGELIESCGLKGIRVGDAMVAEEHANFLVNMGAATATEVCQLMEIVQETVKRQCGVRLEPEVKFLG